MAYSINTYGSNDGGLILSGNYLQLPTGKPATPIPGTMRFNVATNGSELYQSDPTGTSSYQDLRYIGIIPGLQSDLISFGIELFSISHNVNVVSSAIAGFDLSVISSNVEALVTEVNMLEAAFGSNAAGFVNNVTLLVNNVESIGNQVTNIYADFGGNISRFVNNITVLSNNVQTVSNDITTIYSQFGGSIAGFVSNITTLATPNSAISTELTTLSSHVGDNTDTINTLTSSVNGIYGQWGVQITNDINGNPTVAGIQLLNGASGSSFNVRADQFNVTNGTNSVGAFSISGSQLVFNGTITATNIVSGNFSSSYGVGASGKVTIDGTNDNMTVKDTSNVTRVIVGNNAGDYGLFVYDASGTLVISADGLGDNSIGTAQLASGAVSEAYNAFNGATQHLNSGLDYPPPGTWESALSLSVPVATTGTKLLISFSAIIIGDALTPATGGGSGGEGSGGPAG